MENDGEPAGSKGVGAGPRNNEYIHLLTKYMTPIY